MEQQKDLYVTDMGEVMEEGQMITRFVFGVVGVRIVVSEGQPVFVKVDSLFIATEFVTKIFICLVDLGSCCKVAVGTRCS